MIKKFLYPFLLIATLSACVHDYQLKPIDPASIFHGNTSKVWVINHLYQDKKDYAPLSLKYKEMLIFHETATCYFYQVNQFQNGHSKKADFKINRLTNEITFFFLKEKWTFKIKSYSLNKIILEPVRAKKFNYTVELIPFPAF